MVEIKHSNLIVTHTREFCPELMEKVGKRMKNVKSTVQTACLPWLDDEKVKTKACTAENPKNSRHMDFQSIALPA